jgi:hypothetical protein
MCKRAFETGAGKRAAVSGKGIRDETILSSFPADSAAGTWRGKAAVARDGRS